MISSEKAAASLKGPLKEMWNLISKYLTTGFIKVFWVWGKKENTHTLCISKQRLLTPPTSALRREEQKAINQSLAFNGNLRQNVVRGNGTCVTDKDAVEALLYFFKGKEILTEKGHEFS